MTTVRNKSNKPLRIPLPRGKTLHLGPGKTGRISPNDAEHPQLTKLVEAGEIELFDDDAAVASGGPGGPTSRGGTAGGHVARRTSRRSGDR